MPRLRHLGPIAGSLAGAAALALALTGCVPNKAVAEAEAIQVTLTDTACTVKTATAPAGPITFQVTNKGSDVNEFEVLAPDKLRIAGEKENIGPGTTVNYVVQLAEGSYFTACKKGMVGSPTSRAAFPVTQGPGAARGPVLLLAEVGGPRGGRVSAVIVHYRTPRETVRAVRAVAEASPETEILVVDNASGDRIAVAPLLQPHGLPRCHAHGVG